MARSSQPMPCADEGQVVSFPLAQPGEGIKECELLGWSVSVGDQVEAFEPLCEVQSDKATVEITSRYTGRVVALHYAAGEMVQVGAALVDILLPSDGVSGPPSSASSSSAPSASTAPQQPLEAQATDSLRHVIDFPLPGIPSAETNMKSQMRN